MFSRIPNTFSSYCGCFPQFGPPLTEFRLQFVSISYLLLSYMANPATDDVLRLSPTRSSTTSIHGPDSHLPPDDPTSASYIPRAARMTPTSTTVHTIFIKKLSYPFSSRPDELWILERTLDGIETWKPVETFFWRTCTSQGIVPPCAPLLTIGASTMIYPSNHPPPLRQHPFRFSHIPNTPTSTFHNRMKRYRTSFTFYNHAGDVRLNIIHKVPLFLCLGHHGDLHHLPHHRQHFTGPYTRITLPHLFIILIVHYLRTNLALWICLTPVCNTPHHFAKRKRLNVDL